MKYFQSMTSLSYSIVNQKWFLSVLIAVSLILTGCSSVQQPPITVVKNQDLSPNKVKPLPLPSPLSLNDWQVEDKPCYDENNVAKICMTPRDYEIVSKNMAELLRWIKESKWQLDYYKNNLKE